MDDWYPPDKSHEAPTTHWLRGLLEVLSSSTGEPVRMEIRLDEGAWRRLRAMYARPWRSRVSSVFQPFPGGSTVELRAAPARPSFWALFRAWWASRRRPAGEAMVAVPTLVRPEPVGPLSPERLAENAAAAGGLFGSATPTGISTEYGYGGKARGDA